MLLVNFVDLYNRNLLYKDMAIFFYNLKHFLYMMCFRLSNERALQYVYSYDYLLYGTQITE